jgi:hypothetical protein
MMVKKQNGIDSSRFMLQPPLSRLSFVHPHGVIIYFIETKATIAFPILATFPLNTYLLVVCIAVLAAEVGGALIYFISADLFQITNVRYCTLVLFLFEHVISVNIAFKTARWNIQKYLPLYPKLTYT